MPSLSRFYFAALSAAAILPASAAIAAPDAVTAPWWSQQGAAYVATGSGGSTLRISAVDKDIVRVWMSASPNFTRTPSLALQGSPPAEIPMTSRAAQSTLLLRTSGLAVSVDSGNLQVDVHDGSGATILQGMQIVRNGAGWSMSYALNPDEHLMGLGQDNRNGGRLDRRGTVRDLWSGQQINSGNVTASYPIPFLLSTGASGHAYGIFCDDAAHMRWDLGATDPNRVKCDADGGEADFYVIDGPTLKDVITRYTGLTGRAPLPPLWALGYWQSKCVFWNWSDLDEASRQLTQRGFPFDVLVIDYSWPEVLNDYVWDKRWYSQGVTPADKIAGYAKDGVKIVLSNSGPMVVETSPTFASGWKAGAFATDGQGNPVEAGYYHGKLMDFTSPAITPWLQPQVAPIVQSGIAGWWLDLSEPEGEPDTTVYQDGPRAVIHNQYALLESRWYENAQLAVHPNVRPFVLTRTGSAGIQRLHVAVWSGDTHSDYETLGAHPPEMLNSGLSGLNLWTCDTGGFLSGFYKHDRYGAHARLYERWFQFSTFSPLLRTHHSGPVLPYEFGPDTEAGCLHYDQLRYRLLPYIYSYAWEASQTGLPITRPLVMEYPSDPGSIAAKGDEYLFGRELLVAPVLQEDVVSRPVYFPPGNWIDWDTGHVYTGGRTWVVDAPQHRIPVEVRAGAIIPTADPMRNTAGRSSDSLTIEVFPSGESTFTLYNDDGATFGYQTGDFTVTKLRCARRATQIRFGIAEANKLYAFRTYRVKFHVTQRPTAVTVDGMGATPVSPAAPIAVGHWAWDAALGVLTVAVASGTRLNHVVVANLGR